MTEVIQDRDISAKIIRRIVEEIGERYPLIPQRTAHSIILHFSLGDDKLKNAGHFLKACAKGDLKEAAARADYENRSAVGEIGHLLHVNSSMLDIHNEFYYGNWYNENIDN